jgi:hypothetical protein
MSSAANERPYFELNPGLHGSPAEQSGTPATLDPTACDRAGEAGPGSQQADRGERATGRGRHRPKAPKGSRIAEPMSVAPHGGGARCPQDEAWEETLQNDYPEAPQPPPSPSRFDSCSNADQGLLPRSRYMVVMDATSTLTDWPSPLLQCLLFEPDVEIWATVAGMRMRMLQV